MQDRTGGRSPSAVQRLRRRYPCERRNTDARHSIVIVTPPTAADNFSRADAVQLENDTLCVLELDAAGAAGRRSTRP